jgi:hypothetical protein
MKAAELDKALLEGAERMAAHGVALRDELPPEAFDADGFIIAGFSPLGDACKALEDADTRFTRILRRFRGEGISG